MSAAHGHLCPHRPQAPRPADPRDRATHNDPGVVAAHGHVLRPGGGSEADGQDGGGHHQQRPHKPQGSLLSSRKPFWGNTNKEPAGKGLSLGRGARTSSASRVSLALCCSPAARWQEPGTRSPGTTTACFFPAHPRAQSGTPRHPSARPEDSPSSPTGHPDPAGTPARPPSPVAPTAPRGIQALSPPTRPDDEPHEGGQGPCLVPRCVPAT